MRVVVESLASLLGFDDPETVGLDGLPSGVAIGDFDGNGRMDFIAHSTPLVAGQPERNFYYFVRDEKEDEFNNMDDEDG